MDVLFAPAMHSHTHTTRARTHTHTHTHARTHTAPALFPPARSNVQNGLSAWEPINLPGVILGGLAVGDGSFYVGTSHGALRAYSVDKGELK